MHVFSLTVPFFALIFLGYFSARLRSLSEDGLQWMNFFIIYVSLPALFFQIISQTPFEDLSRPRFITLTTTMSAGLFGFGVVYGWIRYRQLNRAAIFGNMAAYSNIGYIGIGLTLLALGEKAAVPAALIFCFDNAVFFVLTPLIMALHGAKGKSYFSILGEAFVKVLTHPFIIATIAGVLAAYIKLELPAPINTTLILLKQAAAPCALFVLGVVLARNRSMALNIDIPIMLLIKLVVHPVLIGVILIGVGGFSDIFIYTAILMASLPHASNVFVLAQQYHIMEEEASTLVFISTVISILTVSATLYMIQNNWLLS